MKSRKVILCILCLLSLVVVARRTEASIQKILVRDPNRFKYSGDFAPLYSPWAIRYDSGESDSFRDIIVTNDGGVLVVGSIYQVGAGTSNGWVVKLSQDGTIEWQETIGGTASDSFRRGIQSQDGGYVVVGSSSSFGAGSIDAWLVKLDQFGSVVWQKTLSSTGLDTFITVHSTDDGGFIVAGSMWTASTESEESLISRFDDQGNLIWQSIYSGFSNYGNGSRAHSIKLTNDGGFIVAGSSWLMKLDSNGNVTWIKDYNNTVYTKSIFSVEQTSDGGYITAGTTRPIYGSKPDAWIMKLDSEGDVIWSKLYGGVNYEEVPKIIQTSDGEIVFSGVTSSFGNGNLDVWIVKLDIEGNILWQKTIGGERNDHSWSIAQYDNNGYAIAADTSSFSDYFDGWVILLDNYGEILDCHLMGESDATVTNNSVSADEMIIFSQVENTSLMTSSATVSDTFVEANFVCGGIGACYDTNDDDGDALPNGWENCGVDKDGDGQPEIDLPALGADPNHKDIFVEIDYMDDAQCLDSFCVITHSHRPNPDAIAIVVDAFENAPIGNVDGVRGINLHVDFGSETPMNSNQNWGNQSRSNPLPHVDEMNWTDFYTLKENCFDSVREGIFHYAVFGHHLEQGPNVGPCTSGQAPLPGVDLIVTLAGWGLFGDEGCQTGGLFELATGTTFQQAGTFMHELGHNLGLHHGGGDEINGKPNYISVMSYAFQTRGLIYDGEDRGTFDYSRSDQIPSLIETDLDETVGLNGGSSSSQYGTRWTCPNGTFTFTLQANNPIDWNCNSNDSETGVTTNVNHQPGGIYESPSGETLTGYFDWNNLTYLGGSSETALGESKNYITTSPPVEITLEQDSLIPDLMDVSIIGSNEVIALPGYTTTYSMTLLNTGDNEDTYTLTSTSSSGWTDISMIPITVTLTSGDYIVIETQVEIPSDATQGDYDLLKILVESTENRAVWTSSYNYTRVLSRLFLPVIQR